jgi:hypothetical protein
VRQGLIDHESLDLRICLSFLGDKIEWCPSGNQRLFGDAVFELGEQPSEVGGGPGVQVVAVITTV